MISDVIKDFMNAPEEPTPNAFISYDKENRRWVSCPYCSKKAFLLRDGTKIVNMPWKCKGSNCKKEFEVNV